MNPGDLTQIASKPSAGNQPQTVTPACHEGLPLSGESLGDFRLIRQIGRGGMGVVYEAEQRSLGRRVAVKVLPFAAMLNDQHRKRFYNEARAAATLDHPHIVPVHFVGQERGVHFFAMHLVEGRSLAEIIECLRRGDQALPLRQIMSSSQWSPLPTRQPSSRPETVASARGRSAAPIDAEPTNDNIGAAATVKADSPPQATSADNDKTSPGNSALISTHRTTDRKTFFQTVARLGAEAAEALQHAHQVGILHRDIKPGNLLVDDNGKLWVADFGLATIEHGETLTHTGGVIGTAAYMSPEQASATSPIDGRSDVYSLGATLYELLTMQRYRSDQAIHLGAIASPSSQLTTLSHIDRTIPVDLQTIVVKALSFDPLDRYSTAGALAEDLRAFIAGREIQARRLSVWQRQLRWLRHHQRLAVGFVVASFLMICAIAIATLFHSHQLQRVLEEKDLALAVAEQSRQLAEKSERAARHSELLARQVNYRTDTQRAFDLYSQNDLSRAQQVLAKQIPTAQQVDMRGVEWWLLDAEIHAKLQLLGSHSGVINECVLYPDGNTVATAGEDGSIQIWDIQQRRRVDTFAPQIGAIHAMAISPDGQTLAVGGKPRGVVNIAAVHLLDAHTGQPKTQIQRHRTTIESIEFSPDGKRIAAGSRYQSVMLSAIDGTGFRTLPSKTRNETIAFSPDSRALATCSNERHFQIWDCETGTMLRDGTVAGRSDHLSWSPCGGYVVVTGWDDKPWIDAFDVETGAPLANIAIDNLNQVRVHAITIAADGETISAGDSAGNVHQWRLNADDAKAYLKSRERRLREYGIIDPRRVGAAGITALVHLADGSIVTTHANGQVILSNQDRTAARISAVDFDVTAADGWSESSLVFGSSDGSIRRFDTDTGQTTPIVSARASTVADLAVSDDRSRLVIAYRSSQVDVLDSRTGTVLWSQQTERQNTDQPFRVAATADGRSFARTGDDNQMWVWSVDQQSPVFKKAFTGKGLCVALSPDGTMVAHAQERVQVFRVKTGETICSLETNRVKAMRFSADGRYLISGLGEDNGVRLLDLTSGHETVMRGHDQSVCGLAVDAVGRTLLSVEIRNKVVDMIYCWDVETGAAYGAIANPLSSFQTNHDSLYKIFVTNRQVILCNLDAPESKVAVWDWGPGWLP